MQNLAGNVPVDLVLLGLIAAFLVLRLRSILGKRTGLERPNPPPAGGLRPQPMPGLGPRNLLRGQGPIVDTRAEPLTHPADAQLPDPSSPAGIALTRLRERDRGFDPVVFLGQAQEQFRTVVRAFAEGDRAVLRANLTADAFGAFDQAIVAREAASQTQRAEIRAITQTRLVDASLTSETGFWRASLEVRFVSDQVSVLLASDGLAVSGADAVTELVDVWTFEQLVGGPKPEPGAASWRLAAARSA